MAGIYSRGGAALMTRGATHDPRARVHRIFAHGDIRRVCQFFARGRLPEPVRSLVVPPVEAELMRVSKAFIELQERRHSEDYDTQVGPNRLTADNFVDLAESALLDWSAVRASHNAGVFLTALALHRQWGRG